jgi:hypothetical protein
MSIYGVFFVDVTTNLLYIKDMKSRIQVKVANPHIRVNYAALERLQLPDEIAHYNNHGSVVDVTPNVAQYGDVKVWCKALGYTAAQFAKLVGRSKKRVIRWLKNPDDNRYTDLTRDEKARVISKLQERTHKLTVPYYDNGTVKKMFCL